jgi:hypothetical protein
MKLKPCKICGSRNITLWDCGYSSFNPGGGRCENGHEGKGECGCLADDATRARVWNAAQKLTPMERLQAENKRLRAENKRLVKESFKGE